LKVRLELNEHTLSRHITIEKLTFIAFVLLKGVRECYQAAVLSQVVCENGSCFYGKQVRKKYWS